MPCSSIKLRNRMQFALRINDSIGITGITRRCDELFLFLSLWHICSFIPVLTCLVRYLYDIHFYAHFLEFKTKMSKMSSKDKDNKTLHDKLKQFFRINKGEHVYLRHFSRKFYIILGVFVIVSMALQVVIRVVKISL
jgi:hypothetical protein